MGIKVKGVAHHRNGLSGTGFHVVLFNCHIEGRKDSHFVGIVFPKPKSVAVLDIDLAVAGNIAFGENSWCGDDFEDELREAIEKYEDARRIK